MFTQEQLLRKAALAAAKGNFQVLKVMVDKILSEDITCISAWEIYMQAKASRKSLLLGQRKLMAYLDRLLLPFLKGLNGLGALRISFFLWILDALPHSSSLRLVLGEWALKQEAYGLTLWAWEGMQLNGAKRKLLVRLYSKLKLHDKAGALAQVVLKEEPYCTEMIDLLQASQFYQSMRP